MYITSSTSEMARSTSSEPAAEAVAPVSRTERIPSVDVLRGAALLGILLLNILVFALPDMATGNPTLLGQATERNVITWFIVSVLFEGKMRAIFSMLFGAGVYIFTARGEERRGGELVADIYYRRTLWLVAFGLVHGYFLWPGDILFSYGIFGLMLFPLRKKSPRFLITAGILLLLAPFPSNLVSRQQTRELQARAETAEALARAGKPLTEEQKDDQKAWAERLKDIRPDPAAIQKEIDAHRAGYWAVFRHRAKEVARWNGNGLYRGGLFDIGSMMIIGMGLMKMGVFSAARSRRFYALMALLGYGIGVPLNAWAAYWRLSHHFDPMASIASYLPYGLSRLTMATGHIGLIMLVCQVGVLSWLTRRLAAVGQMALTNYLTHSVVCTLIFNGYGLGLFGQLERYQIYYVVLGIWIAQLLLSPIWIKRFRFGPMEWVWRSLTYWKPMQMSLVSPARVPLAEPPAPLGLEAGQSGKSKPTGAAGNGHIVIDQLDHLVLTVKDITTTCQFYERVLGMQPIEYLPGRWALHFGRSKLNLHPADQAIDPNVRHAQPGSADLCLLTPTPLDEVNAHLQAQGVPVIEGPIRRTGATGPILSLYVYDPDENLIEIANPLPAATA
ncbi:MAG TPA: DUF418 domain-containing protein [Polyangia bacterium]|jgi:uncharacterized protein|nr:DUF418 domain-containing protein [Polyangia bacterium]